MSIKSVKGFVILDSRGLPTVRACVETSDGEFYASVPSGASTGTKEAVELRDGGDKYLGKNVSKAVENINTTIAKALVGGKLNVTQQKEIDELMIKLDGTENKSKLGANAILAVSQAVCRAGAANKKIPVYQHVNNLYKQINTKAPDRCIPYPFFNVINGGKHADNNLACQEIMFTVLSPTVEESVRKGSEVFHTLKKLLHTAGEATNVGDEGGFAPASVTPETGVEFILKAAKECGVGDRVRIGFDFAASEFETSAESGKYDFDFKARDVDASKHKILNSKQLVDYYVDLVDKYKEIISIEDPFSEFDGPSYAELLSKLVQKGSKCQIVADDLTVTNPKIIAKCVAEKQGNALLVKMNQIGTLTECMEACKLATDGGWSLMVSHRSGETVDHFVADFAVGVGAAAAKFGATSRGERTEKYNRLMEIERDSVKVTSHKFL